jgi:hypothetical protein
MEQIVKKHEHRCTGRSEGKDRVCVKESQVSQDLCPDIILLTETWCNSSVDNAALSLESYRLETDLRSDRCDTANGIGGGLLVYSKHDLKILPNNRYQHSNFNQFCAFSIVTRSGKLDVVLIYRPPSSGPDNLTELYNMLRVVDGDTVFIGDFNIPGIEREREQAGDTRARELLNTVVEEGLEQLVTFPTHSKGNILDLMLTNCPDKILGVSDVGRLGRSDHCMIKEVMDFQPDSQVRHSNTGHWTDWNHGNIDQIKADLQGVSWRDTLIGRPIEDACILEPFLVTLLNAMCPNVGLAHN